MTPDSGVVSESGGSGSCSKSHSFATPGIYTIEVTVTDDDLGADSKTIDVVVYDPSAGFVTGAGSIDSPAGAYAADPSLSGKATLAFVAKYQNGASIPSGQTMFKFMTASFNFTSSTYDWLVVSGPKAQFKGTGIVNGSGDYGFLLTANDGEVPGGGGTDRFRIKIWDKATGNVVYDNQMGEANAAETRTALTGGKIMIHK